MSLDDNVKKAMDRRAFLKGIVGTIAGAMLPNFLTNTANAEENKLERAIKAYEEGKSSGIPKLSLKDLEGYKKQSELDFVHSLDLKGRQVVNFKTKNGTRTAIIFDYPHLGSATIHNYQVGKYNVGILTLPNAEVFGFIIQRGGKKQIMYIDFDNDGRIDYANEVSGYFPWQKLKKPYGWNQKKHAFEISVQDYYNKIAKPVNDKNMPKGLRVAKDNLQLVIISSLANRKPWHYKVGQLEKLYSKDNIKRSVLSIFEKYGFNRKKADLLFSEDLKYKELHVFPEGYLLFTDTKKSMCYTLKIPRKMVKELVS